MKKILSFVLCLFLVLGTISAPGVKTEAEAATVPSNANLLNTYGNVIEHVGTALVEDEILDSSILSIAQEEYNSITVGNEMKPNYILGWVPTTITVAEAKALGYYIPDNYTETTVPKLNFTDVDKMMKACYDAGLDMRGHTLLWHSQTQDWYFRSGYSTTGSYVSESVMNARMEFYIKTYMNHVCSSQYSSVIYAWDVVNEYLHAGTDASGWQIIYGNNLGPQCAYVKRAFQYAYDCLEYFGLTDQVHLFYNDYNTYMEVSDVISLVNYVNSSGTICNGVGMQAHLSTTFPTVAYFKSALQSFCNAGFEVQITELDVGCTSLSTQATYYQNLMTAILDVVKNGGNLTALVWWGMSDDTSWRSTEYPLLYSDYYTKKAAYTSVLQAYFDAGYTMSGSTSSTATPSTSTSTGTTVTLQDGWYYIKNVNSQKYLQVTDNTGAAGQNVEIGTGSGVAGQKWYVTNTSDGYITLTSALGDYMLDVANAANTDGANIQIYNGYSGDAQKFIIKSTSTDRVYTIGTKASSVTKMLDVYNFGTSDGTNVCQWTYGGYKNQQWIFESTSYSGSSSASPSPSPSASTTPSTSTGLPSGITCEYSVVSDWGNSFQGQLTITNNSTTTYNGWTLSCNYNSTITSLWGAELSSQSGSNLIIKNPSWSSTFAPGSSVTINFIATVGSDKNTPTNYSF